MEYCKNSSMSFSYVHKITSMLIALLKDDYK